MAGLGGSGQHRHTVRTPERQLLILRHLRVGGTREAAAGLAEMNPLTLWRWMKSDVAFQRACAEAEAQAESRFNAVVADAAFGRPAQYDGAGRLIRAEIAPDAKHAEWWLERRRPHTYGQRISVDVRRIIADAAAEAGLDFNEVMAEVDLLLLQARGGA